MDLAKYYKKNTPVVGVAKVVFQDLYDQFPVSKIKGIATSTSGGTPKRGNPLFYNGDIPWLKSGELNDSFVNAAEEFITEEGVKNSSAKLFASGTLLVAMYGATAGKTGILSMDATTNQAICAIFPKEETVLRDYLYWFFRQHRIDFILQSKGGAQPNISQKVILNTDVPVPPIEIQKKIIEFLQRLDATGSLDTQNEVVNSTILDKIKYFYYIKNTDIVLSEKVDKQKKLLDQLKQAILQEAIEGKLSAEWRATHPVVEPAEALLARIKAEKQALVDTKKIKKEKALTPIAPEEIPFDLPDGWVWCRGYYVANYIDPQPSHRTPPVSKDNIPYVSMKDISKQGQINFASARKVGKEILTQHNKRYVLQEGDFIFGKIGTIGNPVWLPKPFNYTLSANLILIQTHREILDPKYFFHFLSSPHALKHLTDSKSEMSYPVFGMKKARLMPVILPPLEEQKVIVQKVEALLQKCEQLAASVAQSEQYAQQLMQAVLKEAFLNSSE